MKKILLRILAVFAASGLSVIGAGAIAGVSLWKAILMAGVGGVATVVEGLARAYMNDGKLDADEIDEVFNRVDRKAREAAEEIPTEEFAAVEEVVVEEVAVETVEEAPAEEPKKGRKAKA